MTQWRVALRPTDPTSPTQAPQARWLRADGVFSANPQEAWTMVDPQVAAQRLQQWIDAKGWHPQVLDRLQLVPFSPGSGLAPQPAGAGAPRLHR